MLSVWYSLVFLSFLVLCNAEEQIIEDIEYYNLDCSSVCDLEPLTCNFINYPVYTNGLNLTQAEENVTAIMKTANAVKILLPQCYNSVQLFACTYYYPSCDEYGKPIKPCKDTCTQARTDCAAAYDSLSPAQQEMLNCESSVFEQSNMNCASLNSSTPTPCGSSPIITPKGACYTYNPSVAVQTSDICSPFVSKQIYLLTENDTETQMEIDSSLFQIVGLAEKLFPMTPIQCYQSLLSLMCRSFFPTCHTQTDPYNSSISVDVASLPCRSMCEQTNQVS